MRYAALVALPNHPHSSTLSIKNSSTCSLQEGGARYLIKLMSPITIKMISIIIPKVNDAFCHYPRFHHSPFPHSRLLIIFLFFAFIFFFVWRREEEEGTAQASEFTKHFSFSLLNSEGESSELECSRRHWWKRKHEPEMNLLARYYTIFFIP